MDKAGRKKLLLKGMIGIGIGILIYYYKPFDYAEIIGIIVTIVGLLILRNCYIKSKEMKERIKKEEPKPMVYKEEIPKIIPELPIYKKKVRKWKIRDELKLLFMLIVVLLLLSFLNFLKENLLT